MVLKMYDITELPAFFEKVKTQKLPFKTSYKIALFAQEVQKHIGFYQEKFQELIITYSKKDEEGNPLPTSDGQGILLEEETMAEAQERLQELRNLEVELLDTKFSVEEFEKMELSPSELVVFMPFIEG